MKKLLIILLALSMIFAMCSCNYFERAELLDNLHLRLDYYRFRQGAAPRPAE